MNRLIIRIRHTAIAGTLLAFSAALPLALNAQDAAEPELLVTWRADSYAPPGFRGKALPTIGSAVNFSLELIQDGKIADLSQTEIRWYRNRTFISSGIGQKQMTLVVPPGASSQERIRATAVDFGGEDHETTVLLPVVAPEVVIDAPAASGPAMRFRALPYFFNTGFQSELVFEWRVNGEPVDAGIENPDALDLSVTGGTSGATVTVELRVSRSRELLEFAENTARFILP